MAEVKSNSVGRGILTFLILGRVSNVPTVISNCLAGWWLGGHATTKPLAWLFSGATLLYVGGMFLNDAFDADFDRRHRTERPIPSGAISLASVWRLGSLMLILGWGCFLAIGARVAVYGLALIACIFLYNAVHKRISWAPVLMGLCRFFLYFTAAATGQGISTFTALAALALWAYIVGLSYLARHESTHNPFSWWPLLLLGAPVFLGIWTGQSAQREGSFLLAAVLALWDARALKPLFIKAERNIGLVVSNLLAGIILVDWLAMADAPREFGFAFIALLFSALFLQRLVPAT